MHESTSIYILLLTFSEQWAFPSFTNNFIWECLAQKSGPIWKNGAAHAFFVRWI